MHRPHAPATFVPYTTLFRSAMLASGLPGGGVLALAGAAPTSQPFQQTVQPAGRGDSMEVRFALADIFAQQSIRAALRLSRSEEHTSELQSLTKLVCRLLLEK